MLQAAENTIPKTTLGMKKRKPVVWWNEECKREEKIVRTEDRNTDETQQTKLH